MTPFELDILLHYYGCADDHPVVATNPPIWPERLADFIGADLLARKAHDSDRLATYHLTDRGKAYIEAVLAVPLPVQKWVMPGNDMNNCEISKED